MAKGFVWLKVEFPLDDEIDDRVSIAFGNVVEQIVGDLDLDGDNPFQAGAEVIYSDGIVERYGKV